MYIERSTRYKLQTKYSLNYIIRKNNRYFCIYRCYYRMKKNLNKKIICKITLFLKKI